MGGGSGCDNQCDDLGHEDDTGGNIEPFDGPKFEEPGCSEADARDSKRKGDEDCRRNALVPGQDFLRSAAGKRLIGRDHQAEEDEDEARKPGRRAKEREDNVFMLNRLADRIPTNHAWVPPTRLSASRDYRAFSPEGRLLKVVQGR